ncbi:NAD(P)-dependent dehydrogenase (short-subunit alcohol dehydrogenase family) [Streptomyces phaeochromogenes]|jgi:NAD(P)-dependent dehydrogenase (short-subunit alcohol dehydrogenase family)|uniref:oxidoreductase n=1 Tax=Streptomyces TaxID=1883 RepID=UPI00117D249B|nr:MULTISPECIES: oxidoreductase [Streptomyces]MDQ0947779.1 NAD(P)-dependent dehydrogenase (short-subunit alcohol dehydrogenase family) [Streptomyces phaeochromogenes]TRO67895.1 oxidoreductase [Streptomyces sp. IB201691-2A2]
MSTNAVPVWFITGCSTGLGRALATAVLDRGWKAVVTARDPGTVADIVSGHEDRAVALALDVTDSDRIDAVVKAGTAALGPVDVLVNNAGYGYLAALEEGEDHEIRALFDTNVFGLVDVTRAVLPGMRARRSGHIVNISSLGGLAAFGATGYYHATKFAVEGLSESLAAEVAPLGVNVTIVEPGAFRTNWSGPSMRQSATRIEDYAATAGARRRSTLETYGHQPGDPERAAAAIIAAVGAEDPPLRLLLGKVALDVALARLDALRTTFTTWRDVTLSADYPDND